VLLYGAETWVLAGAMEKALQSFHRKCARDIMGKKQTQMILKEKHGFVLLVQEYWKK
jgi:hypothetical protein